MKKYSYLPLKLLFAIVSMVSCNDREAFDTLIKDSIRSSDQGRLEISAKAKEHKTITFGKTVPHIDDLLADAMVQIYSYDETREGNPFRLETSGTYESMPSPILLNPGSYAVALYTEPINEKSYGGSTLVTVEPYEVATADIIMDLDGVLFQVNLADDLIAAYPDIKADLYFEKADSENVWISSYHLEWDATNNSEEIYQSLIYYAYYNYDYNRGSQEEHCITDFVSLQISASDANGNPIIEYIDNFGFPGLNEEWIFNIKLNPLDPSGISINPSTGDDTTNHTVTVHFPN